MHDYSVPRYVLLRLTYLPQLASCLICRSVGLALCLKPRKGKQMVGRDVLTALPSVGELLKPFQLTTEDPACPGAYE